MKKYAPWLIVLAAILWGTEAPLRKTLTQGLSSRTIVLSEHIIISFLALPLLWKNSQEAKYLKIKGWLSLMFVALGGSALGTIFYTESFRHVNPSVSILLQKTQPFIALLLAFLILKEKLARGFYLWAITAVLGAYLVSLPELKPRSISFSTGALGVLLALLASFFWAGSTVFGRYVLFRINYQALTSLRFLLALLFLFLINLVSGGLAEYAGISVRDVFYLIILAIVVGFVALLFYYRGLADTRASISTVAELAYPLSGVIINWIFLGAILKPIQVIGGAILLLSIAKVSKIDIKKPTSGTWPEPARESL